ncbi:MAG: MFS transporter [Chloroflexota bacterium]
MLDAGKNRYRFLIQAMVILVRIGVGLVWASAGPLLPLIMQEYGLSRGTVSWYVSIVPIVQGALTVPAGILGAKLGLKRVFAVGALLQAGGLAAPFCTDFTQLLMTRVMFAVGTAITVPLAAAIAADWFGARELPFVNGITMSLVSFGNAVAFLVTVPIASAFSWRAPIAVYGAYAFICGVAWLIFGRERRKAAATHTSRSSGKTTPPLPVSLRRLLRQKTILIFALSLLGPFCLTTTISSWLPGYYHDVFGMSLARASSTVSIFTIAGTIAAFTGGILAMRVGRRKPFLMVPGLLFGLAAMSCVMFNHPVIIPISVAAVGIFSQIQAPTIFTIPMELPGITPRTGAIVLSMALGVGNIGGFLGPILVGYLTDLTGSYLPGFLVCCALSLSLFFGGLLIPETGPATRRKG